MRRTLFLLGLAALALACNFPRFTLNISQQENNPRGKRGISYFLVTSDPDATATPTPFQPLDPTSIAGGSDPALTPTPSWGDYPGPTVPSAVSIPPPVPPFEQPAGQRNILLLGSDQRPYTGGFRTDTVLLLTLNPNQGTASLTSFPRDLYVYIPGWTMQRINTAHQHGGFELLADTFAYNFGVRPDHYVLINFWGFVELVDSLGGIYVQVGTTLTDHRDGYGNYTVYAGERYMDGETALWYVRSRYTTSDFDRTRRQQEVLLALFRRILSLEGLKRAPELYQLYRDNVDTDLRLEDITPFLGLAAHLGDDSSSIHNYSIGPAEVIPYRVPTTGAQVLLPNQEAVLGVIRQAVSAP